MAWIGYSTHGQAGRTSEQGQLNSISSPFKWDRLLIIQSQPYAAGRQNRSTILLVHALLWHRYLPNQLPPAYIFYMKTSKDFGSLQFLVKRTTGGGYAVSGQAFKSCKQASAPTWAPEVNQQLHFQLWGVRIKQCSRVLSTYVSTLSSLSIAQTTVHKVCLKKASTTDTELIHILEVCHYWLGQEILDTETVKCYCCLYACPVRDTVLVSSAQCDWK